MLVDQGLVGSCQNSFFFWRGHPILLQVDFVSRLSCVRTSDLNQRKMMSQAF